jgi:hypothetical protein
VASLPEEKRGAALLSISYALNGLFFVYLKTQGCSTSDHPVKAELDRLKGVMAKVDEMSRKK